MARFSEAPDVNLERRFDPASTAPIGTSAIEGKSGYQAMENVSDFAGPLYPITPNDGGAVFGREFVDALADAVVVAGYLPVEHEAIAEVDVNPMLATGDGALAPDAQVSLAEYVADGEDE